MYGKEMNTMKLMKSKAGFTLVELIVVIAILAILAGIAVPVYSGYIKKANSTADTQVLSAIHTAATSAVASKGDASTITVTTDGEGTIIGITVSGTGFAATTLYNSAANPAWVNDDFKLYLNSDMPSLTSDGAYEDGASWSSANGGKWTPAEPQVTP